LPYEHACPFAPRGHCNTALGKTPWIRTVEDVSNIPLSKYDVAPFGNSRSHCPHEAPTAVGGMHPRSLSTLTAVIHLLIALKKIFDRCAEHKPIKIKNQSKAGSRRPRIQKVKIQRSKIKKIVLRGTPHYNTCKAT